jgi:hypothetical protein
VATPPRTSPLHRGSGPAKEILRTPIFYLETSAFRHLIEQPHRAQLRARVTRLVGEHRLVLCTSLVTIEELITTIRDEKRLTAALAALRSLTDRHLSHAQNHELLQQWIRGGPNHQRCEGTFVSWRSLERDLRESRAQRNEFIAGRDRLRERDALFRTRMRRRLQIDGYPGPRARPRSHWDDPELLYAEVRFLGDQLFGEPERLVALVKPLLRIGPKDLTPEQVWTSRLNPWMCLYTRRVVEGVAKQVLRGTPEKNLRNDYYDDIHLLQASVADALVVDDARLAESIQHLRLGSVPRVFLLQEWGAELDRCT